MATGSSASFFVIASLFVNLNLAASSTFRSGSVVCENTKCLFQPDVLDWDSATAVGTFNDTLLTTGWGILDISAGFAKEGDASNLDIMYAAGFLEGVFTARQMEPHYKNLKSAILPQQRNSTLVKKIEAWFIKQRQWTDMMVSKYQDEDPLWRHVGYTMAQFDGLLGGYRSVRYGPDALDLFALNVLNANGDLIDLTPALQRDSLPDWTKLSKEEARKHFTSNGHCSALIKVLPGFENLYMAHSSWFKYQATNRIYKHYNFNVDDVDTASKRVSFSSYPGYLNSLDAYYLLGDGLVMLQTTINVFDRSLYNKLTEDTLFAWQRVHVANMMAHTGKQWTDILTKYNSGTYNNEYMIIDLKKFKPNQPLPDGTLWVADQMPGLVVAGDATDVLREGYFPSYNVPFFEKIYEYSGNAAFAKKHGTEFSYALAPRAKIFRRDQANVTSFETMKSLMRYNDYKHDKYSGGSPMGAICSRGDLVQGRPTTNGCFDTKVTDFAMAKNLQSAVINGPTLGSGFPPFSWTGQFAHLSHFGLPNTYNFTFVKTHPRFT